MKDAENKQQINSKWGIMLLQVYFSTPHNIPDLPTYPFCFGTEADSPGISAPPTPPVREFPMFFLCQYRNGHSDLQISNVRFFIIYNKSKIVQPRRFGEGLI
jgi:hypothetical protein